MKKNIALVAGGYSGEYEISINSARRVLENIDRERFEVFLVIINRETWRCEDAAGHPIPIDRTDFTLQTDQGKLHFDMAMIIIHGTPGEDGKLQGYFDIIGIPYNTCSHDTAAATFNKYYCKLLVHTLGLPLAKHQFFTKLNQPDPASVIEALGLPLFVKPNQNGSSVGISKAKTQEALIKAIEYAYSCDTEILIEEFIKGREITCGVIRLKNELLCLPLCEIVSKKEFFDYEAKYTLGMADELVPAPLPDDLAVRCTDISRKLYDGLNCKGIVRFDYILSNNEFYFLEVNTVPGLSAGSIVPKMVRAHGWTEGEFYTRMIGEII